MIKQKELRIILTGGVTGGHIYPLIAVAFELQILSQAKNIPLYLRYLGACGPYQDLLEANGIPVQRIAESKLRRYFSLLNFLDGLKFIYSLIQALLKMFWFMPDIVFSKGGPGSVAVVLAARFYRIPVIVHESDSVPGLSNLIAGRYAKLILTSFASTAQYFSGKQVIRVGNPVRSFLLWEIANESREKNKKFFGFSPEMPLIFVIGGSQGAQKINEFILDNLSTCLQYFQILHQTGINNYEEIIQEASFLLQKLPPNLIERYKAVPYLGDEIKAAYLAADLVVSRASAGAIFEIAAFGKPSILIPLPPETAAQDHQTKNAYEYASEGAAIVIEQANLLPHLFINQVQKIIHQPEIAEKMSQAARNFSKIEAASKIAQIILELWSNGSR